MSNAQTIINQLGGNKFASMVNADFITTKNGLVVKFKGSKIANHMTVNLDNNDTYTVSFAKLSGINYNIIKEIKGAYAESLSVLFQQTTGLKTSL